MNTLTGNIKRQEFSAQLLWTALILVFFVLQTLLWTVAISLTAGDKSHTVVAGYDEQALNWDDVKELKAKSDALGWRAEIEVGSESNVRGVRKISIRIADQAGSPIDDALVQLSAYHRARAAEKQTIQFEEASDGVYRGEIRIQHSGKWKFSGEANVGDDRFLIEHQTNLQAKRGI